MVIKKMIMVNKLLVVACLLSHVYTCSMEAWVSSKIQSLIGKKEPKVSTIVSADAHNSKNKLLLLSDRQLQCILGQSVDTTKPLENTIKKCLSLSFTCKRFNALLPLEDIGKACRRYDKVTKNELMKKLLQSLEDIVYVHMVSGVNKINYTDKRRRALILVHAGADNNAHADISLLEVVIQQKDTQMLAALLENNVNPNQKDGDKPEFFAITNVDMATQFIKKGVDLNASGTNYPNVLWYVIFHHPVLELISLYIAQGVDVKQRHDKTDDCLLHELVTSCNIFPANNSVESWVKIGEVLITVAPEMINKKNRCYGTPVDYALWRQKYENGVLNKALIELFEKHGGKTKGQLCLESYLGSIS